MSGTAKQLLDAARAWLGFNEHDGTHKIIIDKYNSHYPLAQNYKVQYTDSWCATFVSACAIQAGMFDIIPTECGCERQINLFKKIGSWVEDDSIVPEPGYIIYYYWKDNGVGDCTGFADHVGIVEECDGLFITVIEGNKNDSVSRRTIPVNGRYIRGYGVPKYDKANGASVPQQAVTTPAATKSYTGNCAVELKTFVQGAKDNQIKSIQILLSALGYIGKDGKPLTIDGELGPNTAYAIEQFQREQGMSNINFGTVAGRTWTLLLNA